MFWAWTSEILYYIPGFSSEPYLQLLTKTSAGDPATRSFALAGLNVWAAIFAATVYGVSLLCETHSVLTLCQRPLAVFKTVDQPAVISGNYTAAGFLLVQVFASMGLAAFMHRKSRGSHVGLEAQP